MSRGNCSETCQNCKYFKRYYIISSNLSFSPTNEGFCANYNINKKIAANHVLNDDGCNLWQSYELKKLAQQIIKEDALVKINQTIESFLILLRDEK